MLKLALIAVSAIVLATLGNQALELALQPKVSLSNQTLRQTVAEAPASLSLQSMSRLSNLVEREAEAVAPPARIAIDATLLGTMVCDDDSLSIAAIVERGRARSIRAGDMVAGSTVASIARNRVWFADGAELAGGPVSGVPAAVGPRVSLADTVAIDEVMRTTRALPAFRNGAAIGFKLVSFPPSSPLARLGLSPGDVITTVNGVSLRSPEAVVGLLGSLKSSRSVSLELDRAGSPVHLTIGVD